MSIIELNHISKYFGKQVALNNVSVSINEGEIFGVLGKNGAGKTTLIKIICTLLIPEKGEGSVLGYDLIREDKFIRSNVSLVAPTVDVGVDPTLTVKENLMFWAVVYGLSGKDAEKRVNETLQILNLYNVRDRWAMEISAGMRQKLGIGRAILVRHPLLLLDEPTVKLDLESKFTVREFIKEVRNRFGTTILLTTHYFDEAEELSDRIMIIDKGSIVALDTVANLKSKLSDTEKIVIKAKASKDKARLILNRFDSFSPEYANGKFIFKVPIFSFSMEKILKVFVDMDMEIEEATDIAPELEDIFFKLTGGR